MELPKFSLINNKQTISVIPKIIATCPDGSVFETTDIVGFLRLYKPENESARMLCIIMNGDTAKPVECDSPLCDCNDHDYGWE
jgi:hypothetical protein